MSSNSLPRRVDELFALAEHLADGLNFHETAIGIQQNTEDKVRADLGGLNSRGIGQGRAAQRLGHS